GSIHAERELHDRFSDRDALESALRDAAAAGDVVILGRAGALALRDHPAALHVRLDGPSEARVFRAMEVQSVDEATARERLGETDRARERFVRDIYGLDPTDPGLYTLVLDGTAFTTAACVEVIVAAVHSQRPHLAPVALDRSSGPARAPSRPRAAARPSGRRSRRRPRRRRRRPT